ncbi:hypothetical protein DSO57_1001399 [Entomophthora muscae]|uniref:Uncharacterized protein n=1 Tax=Entomophthora muscae TaxID=34485 RepID=A0ACC2TKA5_9FUNG|nr:hypothetical protein DSO57_1001399 [Entomophthora muscae]
MSDTEPLDNFNEFVANQSVVTQDLPDIPNLELTRAVEAMQPIMVDYATHIEIDAQNEPMETDSNVGYHNSSDIDQEYLNSPMETDSWEGLPCHTNVLMSKSNTPLKISEIKNKVNELKERLSHQVLAGDWELAVPMLAIPPPTIRPKAAATEVGLSAVEILKKIVLEITL